MNTAVLIAQVVIALGIFNVWLLRFGKPTSWRGGTAQNIWKFRAGSEAVPLTADYPGTSKLPMP